MAKTIQEKLNAARALVAKYEAAINAEAILNNVSTGNTVEFNFGRGEKRRVLTGTVIGVKDTDNGKLAAIQSGEGFDAQTYKVAVRDIVKNLSVEAEASEEVTPEGSDPLAND